MGSLSYDNALEYVKCSRSTLESVLTHFIRDCIDPCVPDRTGFDTVQGARTHGLRMNKGNVSATTLILLALSETRGNTRRAAAMPRGAESPTCVPMLLSVFGVAWRVMMIIDVVCITPSCALRVRARFKWTNDTLAPVRGREAYHVHVQDSAPHRVRSAGGLVGLDDEDAYGMDAADQHGLDEGMPMENLSMADAMVAGCWPGDDWPSGQDAHPPAAARDG
jgi:hypothetical protein